MSHTSEKFCEHDEIDSKKVDLCEMIVSDTFSTILMHCNHTCCCDPELK